MPEGYSGSFGRLRYVKTGPEDLILPGLFFMHRRGTNESDLSPSFRDYGCYNGEQQKEML